MYYKIQPEQIQLHTFSSPSGDINFSAGANYVYANLSRFLTGSFAVTGDLSINGVQLKLADSSNYVSGVNCFAIGGISNDVVGERNVEVNGNSCDVYGTGNVVLNGQSAIFSPYSAQNTLLAGRGVSFASGTTGAVVAKDTVASAVTDNGNHSLTLSFQGGTFIENGNFTLKNGNLYVAAGNSGLFSGDLNVLGTAYENGIPLANTGELGAVSGFLTGRDGSISGYLAARDSSISGYLSGVDTAISGFLSGRDTTISGLLDARITNTGAFAYNVSGKAVFNTGDQTISGVKTFHESQIFSQSLFIKGNSGVQSGVAGRTQIVPTGSGHDTGNRGLVAYSGEYFFVKISDDPHIWVRHSGSFNW